MTDDDIIDDIVLPAMAKNRRLQITGCLWFDTTHFFQILEGHHPVVTHLFDHVRTDKRHHGVKVLTAGPVAHRSFKRFSMRVIGPDTPDSLITFLGANLDEKKNSPSADQFTRLFERAIADLAELL